MSNYRRAYVAGGSYFFTLVTRRRRAIFGDQYAIDALRSAMRQVRRNRPFDVEGIVVLPDHLHCILRLPEGDTDFSGRWREIKKACSRSVAPISDHRRERTLWQRRFWEHAIRDRNDWRRHMDYIHYNPVKHGLVTHPGDWPWSSLRRCIALGWYSPDWGAEEPERVRGMNLE
ncbi:MAG: REP-associated tyrosine transposase [Pseudomonadota bacterium]